MEQDPCSGGGEGWQQPQGQGTSHGVLCLSLMLGHKVGQCCYFGGKWLVVGSESSMAANTRLRKVWKICMKCPWPVDSRPCCVLPSQA